MAAVTINDIRFSYLNVFQAKPPFNNPNGEAKFSATILVPKSNTQAKAIIDQAIAAAIGYKKGHHICIRSSRFIGIAAVNHPPIHFPGDILQRQFIAVLS